VIEYLRGHYDLVRVVPGNEATETLSHGLRRTDNGAGKYALQYELAPAVQDRLDVVDGRGEAARAGRNAD